MKQQKKAVKSGGKTDQTIEVGVFKRQIGQ